MKQLAICCPSRERPGLCRRMIDSALANSEADVLIYVDEDDAHRVEYFDISQDFKDAGNDRVKVCFGEPQGRGQAINALCAKNRDYRMYLVVSDDITFARNDWEKQVIEAMDAFGDDIGCVHLESENGKEYVNWAIVSRTWLDTLGWFNHPGMTWFCQDSVIQILAEAIDRITFIRPKVIDHHVTNHPQMMQRFNEDVSNFLWYCVLHFRSDMNKLREAIRAKSR